MNKWALIFFLFALIAISCTPAKDDLETQIPPGIITPDSMTAIIAQMHYTEAILREFKRRGQDNEIRSAAFYKQTFDKFGITSQRYKKSIAFYEENQEAYYKIYTDVISRLTEIQTDLTNSKEEAK